LVSPFASSAIARNRHPQVPLVRASARWAARSAIRRRRRGKTAGGKSNAQLKAARSAGNRA